MTSIDQIPNRATISKEQLFYSFDLSVVESAIYLYRLGFNLIPVIHPIELKILAERDPEKYHKENKQPFLLEKFFHRRLHLCNEDCISYEMRTGKNCPGRKASDKFDDLFTKANLGIILGKTSGNLICIDCDEERSFNEAINSLSIRGVNFFAYKTGMGGHLLLRVKEGEIKNKNECIFPKTQIWGNNHFCVCPPSAHHTGTIYTWLLGHNPFEFALKDEDVPQYSINEFDWLGIELKANNGQIKEIISLPPWTYKLSAANRKILSSVHYEGERNSSLVKPLYDIAALIKNGDVGFEQGYQILTEAADHCVPPLPHYEILKMLRSAIKKQNLSTAHDFFQNNNKLFESSHFARAFAHTYDWRTYKRTGLIDKAVFLALCDRFDMERSQPFRATCREVAILSNIADPNTVSRALKRLQAFGFIKSTEKDRNSGYRYIFQKMVLDTNQHIVISSCKPNVVTGVHPKYDKSSKSEILIDILGKLGKVSTNIYSHLLDTPEPSMYKISEKAKLHYSSVKKAFPKLIKLGLVSKSKSEGQFFVCDLSEDELFVISQNLGVQGKSQERRRKFAVESELYLNLLVKIAEDRVFRKAYSKWDS